MESKSNETESFFEKVQEQVTEYVKLRFDLLKMELVEKAAKVAALIFSMLLLFTLLFFTIFFISLMAGYYFSNLLQNTFYGFGIIAIIYLFLFLFILAFRKSLIEKPLINRIIRIMFEKQ